VRKIERGFTVLELLIAVVVILVLATYALKKFEETRRSAEFLNLVSRVEYAVRGAKVRALELSEYVKVRVENNSVFIERCGYDNASCIPERSISADGFVIEANRSEFVFTPRGLSNTSGSICVMDPETGMNRKIIINRGGIRVEIEEGGSC